MRKRTEIIKLDQIPTGTAQQRKMAYVNGRVMSYPSKSLTHARTVYNVALRRLEKPLNPFDGAVTITLSFLYGTKDKRKIKGYWKTTKPDVDNLAKVFIDELCRVGWLTNDANISSLTVSKRWHSESMILMQIEEVDSGQ